MSEAGAQAPQVTVDLNHPRTWGLSEVTYHNGDSPLSAPALTAAEWGARRTAAHALRRELKAMREVKVTPALETRFFESHQVLVHIYLWAMASGLDPWAVLMASITYAVSHIPPYYLFFPELQKTGSPNMITLFVGPSGAGKGRTAGAGRSAFLWPEGLFTPTDHSPKSGSAFTKPYITRKTAMEEAVFFEREGEIRALKQDGDADQDGSDWNAIMARSRRADGDFKEKRPVQTHFNALFDYPEITSIGAQAAKSLAIIAALCQGWSGERLGGEALDDTYAQSLKPGTYRLCVTSGVQPANLPVIMKHNHTGLPQRALWANVQPPAGDETFERFLRYQGMSTAPMAVPEVPWADPHYAKWMREEIVGGRHGAVTIPTDVRRGIEVELFGRSAYPEDYDPLDMHEGLTRMSVALGLSMLTGFEDCAGQVGFNEQVWKWSGLVMAKSRQVREDTIALAEKIETEELRRSKEKQGRAQAAHDLARDTVVGTARSLTSLQDKIRGLLDNEPNDNGWIIVPTSQFSHRQRDMLPAMLEQLADKRLITFARVENGYNNRLTWGIRAVAGSKWSE